MIFAFNEANAQSMRRNLATRIAPSPSDMQRIRNTPLEDFFAYSGRIIHKEEKFVIVKIDSNMKVSNWDSIYYACDKQLNPIAILKETSIKHKSCKVFEIENGDVYVSDIVMQKFIAPKKVIFEEEFEQVEQVQEAPQETQDVD